MSKTIFEKEDNELDEGKKETNSKPSAKKDLEQMKKTLDEQEILLRGYQFENEKLYGEIKELKEANRRVLNKYEEERLQLKYDLILKKDPPPWMTHTEYGEKCVAKVFDLIQNITNGLKESRDKEIIKKYVKIYTLNNLNVTINDEKNDIKLTKACKEPSDIFYLPKRLFKDFTVISKIFSENKVFLESIFNSYKPLFTR